MLTSLLAVANDCQTNIVTHLCDMPILISREIAVGTESLDYFKNIYKHWEANSGRKDFSVEEYARSRLLNRRVEYAVEVMRQVCHISKSVVAVVPRFWVKHVEAQWKSKAGSKERKLRDLLKLPSYSSEEIANERIQKHVLVELMVEPFITEFYIRYKVFPFNYADLVGGRLENDMGLVKLWNDCLNSYYNPKNRPL